MGFKKPSRRPMSQLLSKDVPSCGSVRQGAAALSGFSPQERARREALLEQYTDADFSLAPWLSKQVAASDPLRDGFVPIGSDLRDFSIIKHEQTYHVYYTDVRHGKSSRRPDNLHYVGHASTANFTDWQVHRPALFIAPGTWEGAHIWAPYVFAIEPSKRFNRLAGIPVRFVMMYTGLSASLTQSLGMAFSSDLHHWVRYDGNPAWQPVGCDWACWSKTRLANCRDPHVLKCGDRYLMYYTALRNDADCCVALAESTDLENWRDCGPVLTRPIAERSPGITESSCVHPIGDRYVLFYSQDESTRYCISDNPYHFESGEPDPVLVKEHWGIEVVERKGEQWLVALFRRSSDGSPGALFWGVIRWNGEKPQFSLVGEERECQAFLDSR